ncbi:MAG: virginiamycin B lyase, partial [Candidatus Eremiobacteraeota bacterium]|nr:virginiamycin B lyase [Candidatus Eremiobacteraeota bacterium]
TSGASELFPVGPSGGLPIAITPGADGAMWFAACPNSIGRIATDGSVTAYTVPVANSITFYSGIARGADGALWFTQPSSDRIGRLQ